MFYTSCSCSGTVLEYFRVSLTWILSKARTTDILARSQFPEAFLRMGQLLTTLPGKLQPKGT